LEICINCLNEGTRNISNIGKITFKGKEVKGVHGHTLTLPFGRYVWHRPYKVGGIIDSNEDIHAEDATNKFLYHLVCDECQKELQQDYKSFDFDSEELKFRVVLDDAGKPLVEDCKVTLDQLEVMLVNARKKQPGVDVTIVMPEGLPFKHMRIIQHLASKAGITYINFNFIKNSEIKSE
jgi:hypothetical protein